MPHTVTLLRTAGKRRSPNEKPDTPQASSALGDSLSGPMEQPARFVGLDVHKRQITYCILDRDGITLREGEFELTRELLTKFASTQLRPTDHVVLESATNCWAVVAPLGHFFQRLKRRKNHNVAVVATARKLATIAWRMLTSGEPYRYAAPETTAAKLASLRIMATGEKRRGGGPKGVKCVAKEKLPGGSRTIRALDDVYQDEGLPARSMPQPGELRHLTDTHTLEFADAISTPTLIPRNTGKPRGQSRKNTDRLPATTLPGK